MADDTSPDFLGTISQLVRNATANAPNAIQQASDGNQRAIDMARQSNQSGLDFLKNYDQGRANLPLLAAAGAMAQPTKSFFESMGNGFTAGAGAIRSDRQAEMDRFAKMQAIQLAQANLEKQQGEQMWQNMQRSIEGAGLVNTGQGLVAGAQYQTGRQQLIGGVPGLKGQALAGQISGSPDVMNGQPGAAAAPPPPMPSAGNVPPPPPSTGVPYPALHGVETTTPPEMNMPPSAMSAPAATPSQPDAPAPAAPSNVQMQAPSPQAQQGNIPSYLADAYEQAINLRKYAAQNAMVPAAQKDLEVSQKMLDGLREKNLAYDPQTRSLVPIGELNPQIAAAKEYAVKSAAGQAENANRPGVTPSGEEYVGGNGAPMPAGPQGGAPSQRQGNAQQGPTRSAINPQDATVQTAIPKAPPGGGYPVPNLPAGARMTKVGDQAKEQANLDKDFQKDFLEKAPTTDIAAERFRAMAQAFKLVQSGSTTEKLAGWAAIAQSYGQPELAKKILGGDPSAVQWIDKNGVNLVLDTLKAATPRFAQSEFNKLSEKGVPTPENLPQANHQMITEGLGLMMRNQAFIRDWGKAQQEGWTSPSAFYREWSTANPLNDFQRAAQRQVGNFKGMPLPPAGDMAAGTVYVVPDNLSPEQGKYFAQQGLKPGGLFRYNGKGAGIAPIDPSKNYSAHLEGQ